METQKDARRTYLKLNFDHYIYTWVESFLLDRKAQNLATGTLKFYRAKLKNFLSFCEGQAVTQVDQVDSNLVRSFIFWLQERGHNPGGIHAHYRTIKAFIRFWAAEVEPEGWRDPFRKIKAPKVAIEPLKAADLGAIRAMLDTCDRDFYGLRDRAILLFLLDTGVRAAELLGVDLEDVDLILGVVQIRRGKGRKPRRVYLGRESRKALRSYLAARDSGPDALFLGRFGDRLGYTGLRGIVRRRAARAGVDPPTIHAFRRAFALAMLRAGVDIYTLQKLMGHKSLAVLRRYLAQSDDDLAEAHRRSSPVDKSL
jgi:integrase/recombinase XerD